MQYKLNDTTKSVSAALCTVVALLSVLTAPDVQTPAAAQTPPQLGKAPIKEVIAAMTPEEKVLLLVGTGMQMPPGIQMPPEMQGPVVGETLKSVPGAAGTTAPIARLGIPSIVLADGPAGLRIQPRRPNEQATFFCTAFPIATLLASTWDTGLVQRVGRAMGNEVKEYGVDVILGPALNTHRNPLGGRNFEYYSEDPLISGRMAAAMVQGIQSQGVGTSVKHFAANDHEWNRNVINVIASERALREIYLRGFEIAITEGRPWTVMSSYNRINSTYTSEDPALLTSILRGDWKFDGLVMTDWFGGSDAVAQMKAGNDLLMPGTGKQYQAILAAVKSDSLKMAVLDRNVEKMLNIIVRAPSFKKYPFSNKPDLKGNALIAREAAASGMVLLKNNGAALPLKKRQRLAVLGNASYEMITGGTGSGDVNEAYSISLIQGLKGNGFIIYEELVSVYQKYLADAKANRPRGQNPFALPPPIAERSVSPEEIAALESQSDVALITIGRNSGEFADRKLENDFNLSAVETKLIHDVSTAYHAKGKKVVVILNIGGPIETVSWRNEVDAILLAWQPGQEAGNAIADVLSGKVNPSGKLATTFPVAFTDVPSSANFPGKVLQGPDPNNRGFMRGDRAAEVVYQDGIWVGYRYFSTKKVKTAYPFGYGLSYTKFTYDRLLFTSGGRGNSLKAVVRVTNTGKVAGREVIQLYVTAPGKGMVKPALELKGFAKTSLLQPGQSQVFAIPLPDRDLASFDTASSSWVTESGIYTAHAGASAEDIRLSKPFRIARETRVKMTKSLSPANPVPEISVR